MLDSKLIDRLRCPVDGEPLELAGNTLIQQLNVAIARGGLRDCLDQKISLPLDAGLLNKAANRLYPVRGGIPSLVADEAIEIV